MSWQLWPQNCRIEPRRHVKESMDGTEMDTGNGHKLRHGYIMIKGVKRHQRAGLVALEYDEAAITTILNVV
jgi:hypothetical protein